MGKNKGKRFNASKRCTLVNMLMGKAKVAAIASALGTVASSSFFSIANATSNTEYVFREYVFRIFYPLLFFQRQSGSFDGCFLTNYLYASF